MFSSPLKRSTFSQLFRPSFGAGYSSVARASPKGPREILEKRPEDVVITFAKRTAMGRAKKGQLNNVPVDKLLHSLFKVKLSELLCPITNWIWFLGNPREISSGPFETRRHLCR